MNDLLEFLRARRDDEERAAETIGQDRIAWLTYRNDDGHMLYTTVATEAMTDVWIADGKELPIPARTFTVYDPARRRREIEAKRRIIARYEENPAEPWPLFPLLAMAVVDADHPDYREEWRP